MERTKRNANIELLRIISMLMVIALHALGKAECLENLTEGTENTYISWIIESFSICAVNVYVLISGYFMTKSRFKSGRLLELIGEVYWYLLGALIIGLRFGIIDKSTFKIYELFRYIFPIHMQTYWFATSYILMYLLSPLLAKAVCAMNKKQHRAVIILLLVYESVIKSISVVKLEDDAKGYSAIWFVILFVIAAYFRLYGFDVLKTPARGFVLYIVSACLIFAEKFAIDITVARTGHIKEMVQVCYHYNHIFVLLEAIGLFGCFINMKDNRKGLPRFAAKLSPYAFGVYLCHEALPFRFEWTKWLGVNEAYKGSVGAFVLRLVIAIVVVYVVGTAVDFVRNAIVILIKKAFAKSRITAGLKRLDNVVNGEG